MDYLLDDIDWIKLAYGTRSKQKSLWSICWGAMQKILKNSDWNEILNIELMDCTVCARTTAVNWDS